MKNKYIHIILLVIPVLLLFYSALLRYAEGPFFLNTLYDPCYVYLINSLNLAQFVSPAHFDHPGTPVQIIGAIVIKITHLFNNKSGDLAVDVLSDPEYYLSMIHITLAVINSFIVFIASLIIYKTTKNIYVSMLLQLSPLASYMISYELSVITAENFMIAVIMLLIAFSIKFISSGKENNITNYALIFSLICGLGVATKITFIPLVIIPFILLNGLKEKLKFILLTCFSFLLFFLPSISNLRYFIDWIKSLFIFDGLYGKGNPGIINLSAFYLHLKNIFFEDILFVIIFWLILITVLITYQSVRKPGISNSLRSEIKLLLAIFISMSVQILIVAKHYSGHYMVPALMLSLTGLYLCVRLYSNSGFKFPREGNANNVYVSLILIIITITVIDTFFKFRYQSSLKENAFETLEFIDKHSGDGTLISSYGSSSKSYALAFSTYWAGDNTSRYKKIIHDIYPEDLYYDFWGSKIYSISENNAVNKSFTENRKIYLQNRYFESNEQILKDLENNYNFKNYTISNIYTSENGEKIFEICLNK